MIGSVFIFCLFMKEKEKDLGEILIQQHELIKKQALLIKKQQKLIASLALKIKENKKGDIE